MAEEKSDSGKQPKEEEAAPAGSGTGASEGEGGGSSTGEEAPKSGTGGEGGGGGGESVAEIGSGTGATGSSAGSSAAAAEGTGSQADAAASSQAAAAATEAPKAEVPAPPAPAIEAPSRPKARRGKEPATLTTARYGLVGAGKMADAIAKGLINHTKIESKRVFVASKSGHNHDVFKGRGSHVTKRNYDIFAKMDCDVIFLCLHGWIIKQLYAVGGSRPMSLTTNFIPNQRHPIYILSLVGGIPLNDIKKTLLNPDNPEKYKVEMHRIMLNASVAYGLGMGAIDADIDSKKCSPIIRDVLTSFAKIDMVPEEKMDVACALAGNGLSFCYYFLEALAGGGVKIGLPKAQAYKLAAKTLKSCSMSMLEAGKKATEMKDMCAAPGSPTLFGMDSLDKRDTASGVGQALEATFSRLKELVTKDINIQ